MVFTDIQASTVLWARYPEQMGRGIDVHHATLRDLISRHKGYEVKTIGDSFMVAFKDVDDAARFALTSQSALHDAPWETTAFDDVYDKLLSEQHPDLSKAVSNGTSHGLWRGIRVRLGVHYGTGRIIIDETTKHRDYYGTVVNVAARVEGCRARRAGPPHRGYNGRPPPRHDATGRFNPRLRAAAAAWAEHSGVLAPGSPACVCRPPVPAAAPRRRSRRRGREP